MPILNVLLNMKAVKMMFMLNKSSYCKVQIFALLIIVIGLTDNLILHLSGYRDNFKVMVIETPPI